MRFLHLSHVRVIVSMSQLTYQDFVFNRIIHIKTAISPAMCRPVDVLFIMVRVGGLPLPPDTVNNTASGRAPWAYSERAGVQDGRGG